MRLKPQCVMILCLIIPLSDSIRLEKIQSQHVTSELERVEAMRQLNLQSESLSSAFKVLKCDCALWCMCGLMRSVACVHWFLQPNSKTVYMLIKHNSGIVLNQLCSFGTPITILLRYW